MPVLTWVPYLPPTGTEVLSGSVRDNQQTAGNRNEVHLGGSRAPLGSPAEVRGAEVG